MNFLTKWIASRKAIQAKKIEEFNSSEFIPIDFISYSRIIPIFYIKFIFKMKSIVVGLLLFWMPIFVFVYYFASMSEAVMISSLAFLLFLFFLPPAFIYLHYFVARKNPEKGLRRYGYLSDFK